MVWLHMQHNETGSAGCVQRYTIRHGEVLVDMFHESMTDVVDILSDGKTDVKLGYCTR